GPVAIRYPRGAGFGVPLETSLRLLPWGRGEVLKEGGDIAVIAIGNMVMPAFEAARKLEKEGILIRVINARFVKPLDKAWLLEALQGVKSILTVEENVVAGGFGSSIHELLEGEPFAIRNLGIPDKFIEQGTQPKLRGLVGLTEENIADTLRSLHAGARVGLSSH